MATDYSVQLQGAQGVASADPSSAARAIQMQGNATSAAIGAVGGTLFDVWKGYQEEGVRQDQQMMFDELKGDFDALKNAEIANNAALEQSGKTPAAVEAFKKEQERIGAALSQMPERAAEWRMRSSKALREAIAKNPGLANSFRQVTQEVTGLKDLDTYSVTNLYDEIDAVAKRQQAVAKAQAQAEEEARKAFVKDVGGVMSETEANNAYAKMTPDQRLQVASDAFKTGQRKKAFDESLKSGGQAIENGIVDFIAAASTGNVALMNAVRTEMRDAGIDEGSLITGKLTQADLENPKAAPLLAKAAGIHRDYVEKSFSEGMQKIQAALRNGTVDSQAARNAMKDLQGWYDQTTEQMNKHGAVPLLAAMAGADESDPQKTLDTRLRSINLMMDSFRIPPEVAADFMRADPNKQGQMRTQYPQLAQAFDTIGNLRRAAMTGVSNKDWIAMIQKASELESKATVDIPRDRMSQAATALKTEGAVVEMTKDAVVGKVNPEATLKALSGAFAMRDNGVKLLKESSSAIQRQMSLIPESEKGAFLQQLRGAYDTAVFGAMGHGDAAFMRLEEYKKNPSLRQVNLAGMQVSTSVDFADKTGATPLAMKTYASAPKGASEGVKFAADRFNAGANVPSDVNAALASVDTAIRVLAFTTGQDVRELRKEFITAIGKGRPSETYVAGAVEAVKEAAKAAPKPAKQTEAQKLSSQMASGAEDLKVVIEGLKASLADTKPGTALYTRTEADLAAAEAELKRLGGK